MTSQRRVLCLICLYATIITAPCVARMMQTQTNSKGEKVSETQDLRAEIERLKDSIHRWNRWTIGLFVVGFVAAGGFMITAIAVESKNKTLEHAQDRLTALAEKEAAEAQLALKQYIDDVNRDRGPRMIVDHKAFVEALRGKPKAKAEILFAPDNEEAFELASMIRRWLGPGVDGDGAGWEVGEPKPIPPIGGDPKVSPFAPPGIRYGAMGGMAIASNRLWTPLDKNTAYEGLMDAFFTARLVPSGERIPALPDNLFIIIIGQKR
jgi:hypothetical protein